MRLVKGNKIVDLAGEELKKLASEFKKVVIDLGTGDGRFVYKNALQDSMTLYIGVDPAEKQMEEFSKKAVRKKLENVLFAIGSIEQLPSELGVIANSLFIILPWGTLLKTVVKPKQADLENIKNLIKKGGTLEIIFGYDDNFEPTETERLQLEKIDLDYLKKELIPLYEHPGFKLLTIETLEHSNLRLTESTWGKRISSRAERKIYRLVFGL